MLGVIGNKFSIGKETYQPYSAELHYFRIDKRHWSICFERIKRAGFRIISTTVPWNIHQDDAKFIDFNGFQDPRKDLIVFLELAREFAFKVILRPGPWTAAQVPFGGLPRALFNDIKLFARDSTGAEVKLPDTFGVEGGYLPSYLHPNFQFHLKNYFKAFIETTKNYVHPRGPIFMIELDYETSFGRQLDPDRADFNPEVLSRYYPQFLEKLYVDVKKLNARYHEKHETFASVEPPRKFTELAFDDYAKVLDWFKFREYVLNTYLEVLEDMFKSYTVEPLFFRSLYFAPGELLPTFNLVPEDRSPFLGTNVFPEGNYFDLSNKARFLKAEYGFAFATSFTSGAAAADPEREEKVSPISDNARRFYYAAGLSSGFKGMNHYMFVDRDRWFGAPLHVDGTVSSGYELAKNFNSLISTIGFDEMEPKQEIAVVANRMYYWLRRTSSSKEFTYVKRLLDDSTAGFCRDLMRLKLNYAIRENRIFETLKDYKLIFVPSTEIMAEKDQEALVDLAKAGVTIIMCGLMPRFDENLKECQVLANHFRIKTTVDYHIGSVTHKNGTFPTYIYGSVRPSDDGRSKKVAQEGTKIVAVSSTRFKGTFHLFAFDIASGGNHQKLTFLDSVLAGENISSHLYCSDPSVDVSFQIAEKKGILFVVVPPPGELSEGYEARQKEIIVRADLKELGFSAAQIKLTNILQGETTEPIKTSSKELKDGIPLTVQFPDGLIFLVDKR
jgi:beta-galactosidase GanA